MTKAPKNKIQVPFHPLTEEELKEWYRKKYITTPGYLLAIKKVTRPPGVDLKIPNVLEFCRSWGITKSAFYRAVSILNVNNDMDWEPMGGIVLKTPERVVSLFSEEKCPTNGTVSHKRDGQSHERDSESHKRDGQSHERDSESHKRDNRSPKPAPEKASSPPQTIQTYSNFNQTLSDNERESFLEFGRKKASQLPKPPELPLKWIEANWEELRSQWQQTPAGHVAASSQVDWTSHPNWAEWLDFMRVRGVPTFVALGEGWFDRKTRREIADWADEQNLIWGVES